MPRPKGSRNGVRNLTSIICAGCGQPFNVEPWQVRNGRKHCSAKCRKKYDGLTNAEASIVRRNRLKTLGLCVDCAKNATEDSHTRCSACLAERKLSNKKWADNNREFLRKRKKEYNANNHEKIRERYRKYRKKLRDCVLDLYGGKCVCCGEPEKDFLQFDHIYVDGKKHRQEVGNGDALLRDYKNNFETYNKERIRVLCANCHFAITCYGVCPHERDRQKKISENPSLAV